MVEQQNANKPSSSWVVGVPYSSDTAAGFPADNAQVVAPAQLYSETSSCGDKCKVATALITTTLVFGYILGLMIIQDAGMKHLNIGIRSLSVSCFNFSETSHEVTANWEVDLLIRNPNPLSNEYGDDFKLSVWYNNQLLSESSFPGVGIAGHDMKTYNHTNTVLGKRLNDIQVADAIARDWSRGVVAFTLRMVEQEVHVICKDLKVVFAKNQSSFGTMMVGRNETDKEAFARCSKA